jgi:hypothetical protein
MVMSTDRRETDQLLAAVRQQGFDPGGVERVGRQLAVLDKRRLAGLYAMSGGELAKDLARQVTAARRDGYTGVRLGGTHAGLLGQPAGTVSDVAAAHHIGRGTLLNRVRQVGSRGALTTLTPVVLLDVIRASLQSDDPLSRRRVAELLGLRASQL